jgi:1-acyl-sn-glycerol-3-phosphate acyltransferase
MRLIKDLVYELLRVFGYLLFRVLFKLQVSGRENIPSSGSVLVVSNHQSLLDPIILAVSMRRHANFMAKAELFKVFGLSWIIRFFNAFPVSRTAIDKGSISKALDILKEGSVLVIFPEGTRSKTGAIGVGLPGAGMIALKGSKMWETAVVPARITGARDVLPVGAKMIRRGRISVSFGQPMNLFPFLLSEKFDKRLYQKVSNEIMEGIKLL